MASPIPQSVKAFDKLRLPRSLTSFHQALSNHIHYFNPLRRPPCYIERAIAETSSHPLLDESVVRLDEIIEILHSAQFTILW